MFGLITRLVGAVILLGGHAAVATELPNNLQQLAEWIELAELSPEQVPPPPPDEVLKATGSRPLADARVQLAHRLMQARFYEEALAWSAGLAPEQVSQPSQLLIERAVAQHALTQWRQCATTLKQLEQQSPPLPVRYAHLADQLKRQLAWTKAEKLRNVAGQMADADRRLDLGRSGDAEVKLEEEVLAALDKIIDQKQKEQDSQQQQQQQAGAGAAPAATPMQQSQPGELKGPGQVDPRRLVKSAEWGQLPPAERQKVLQQLAREFPAHYQQLIEEYYKSLADEPLPAAERTEP